CGKLSPAHELITEEVTQLKIISAFELKSGAGLTDYNYLLVDEAHRMFPEFFDTVVASVRANKQVCVWSSDPEQVLTTHEKANDIAGRINALPPDEVYTLSEKFRINKELSTFIQRVKNLNHKPEMPMDYSNVEVNCANSTQEAQYMLEYYRGRGYVFINYSKPAYGESPYSAYEEDFDTHHVIGQEFDKVVMLLDSSFYYDEEGFLHGIPFPDPDFLYPNLFYQGVTRVRENLALIVVKAPEVFGKIASILEDGE
ncbi:MAG: DUF2075 domain-containing protein, partial [Lachnospiraceae bacterium]|nr:DUF2075 domain-containing protein [Lachnospiraceae bacterium]